MQLEDYHSFLVSYMGYTIEEVAVSMHLSQDHKICVLKMLSLWRCKDGQDGVKTVGELLSVLKDVLQRGPYNTMKGVVDGKCSIASCIRLMNSSILVLICRLFETGIIKLNLKSFIFLAVKI